MFIQINKQRDLTIDLAIATGYKYLNIVQSSTPTSAFYLHFDKVYKLFSFFLGSEMVSKSFKAHSVPIPKLATFC